MFLRRCAIPKRTIRNFANQSLCTFTSSMCPGGLASHFGFPLSKDAVNGSTAQEVKGQRHAIDAVWMCGGDEWTELFPPLLINYFQVLLVVEILALHP